MLENGTFTPSEEKIDELASQETLSEQTPETPATESVEEAPATPEDVTPTPLASDSETSPLPETEAPVEETAAPAEPPAEPAAEVVAASSEETVAEADSPAAEGSEEEAPSETETTDSASATVATEEEAPELLVEAPEAALLAKIDELIADKENVFGVLELPDPSIFTHILQYYTQAKNLLAQSAKVGLLKRSFDRAHENAPASVEVIEAFHQALDAFNQKRDKAIKAAEAEKSENSKRKADILTKLQEIVAKEDPMQINEVRALQEEWKTIGHVAKEDVEALYKQYRSLLDQFYRQREMHFEMLEYDRKINLQEKERIIKEVETLIPPEEDRENLEMWKVRMDQLSELQQQWRATGHVPREEMERINNSYRETVDKFFDARKIYIELQDKQRQENEVKKRELLEKMGPYAEFSAEKPRAWNDATQQLREYQEAWKEIGQASQSVNGELWHKYREICNTFFNNKSTFFKALDQVRSENLEKKRALCERVEAMAESTEWEKTAKELKQIQNEWKQVGPVPERHSNKLWNRFRAACDTFFENRRKHYQVLHEEEYQNLAKKQALVDEVAKFNTEEIPEGVDPVQRIRDLQKEWKEIGKVPYKEKDKIWKAFRKEIDAYFDNLSANRKGRGRRRDDGDNYRVRASLEMREEDGVSSKVKVRISRIRKKISQSQEKVDQYSTNILYIAKGKSGNALREQIQKEIDREKAQIKAWKDEIKGINEAIAKEKAEAEAKKAEAEAAKKAAEEASAKANTEAETPEAEATPETEATEPTAEQPEASAKETTEAPAEAEAEATETETPEAAETSETESSDENKEA